MRTLYTALLRVAPPLGGRVALAAVVAETDGPAPALAALAAIDDPGIDRFQPAWATRAHLLWQLGALGEAADAYREAIRLSPDESVRAHLTARLQQCESGLT